MTYVLLSLLAMRMIYRIRPVHALVGPYADRSFASIVAWIDLPEPWLSRVKTVWAFVSKWWRRLRRLVKWYVIVAVSLIIISIVGLLAAESIWPLQLPVTTMSNGQQTVIFEGMIHIGSPRFYASVQEDIAHAKAGGATYFYEGVRPSPDHPETDQKLLSMVTGVDVDLDTLYITFAQATGLTMQKIIADETDVNVDIDVWDLYQRLLRDPPKMNKPKEPLDPHEFTKFVSNVHGMTDGLPTSVQHGLQLLARNTLSVMLQVAMSHDKDNPISSGPILVYRNQILANAIERGPATIIVTYGNDHAKGLLEILQQDDPNWHIVSKIERNVLQ
jgi:hypothetical protein